MPSSTAIFGIRRSRRLLRFLVSAIVAAAVVAGPAVIAGPTMSGVAASASSSANQSSASPFDPAAMNAAIDVAVSLAAAEAQIEATLAQAAINGVVPSQPAPRPTREITRRSTVPTGQGIWSVTIGINDYPGTARDLIGAVNDATDFDRAMAGIGAPAAQRMLLTNGAASAARIHDALQWLIDNAGPDATAVVMYAGHAIRTANGRDSITAANDVRISDLALRDRLRPLAAGKTLIVMAACTGGGFDELVAPGRALIAAAGAGQTAYETTQYNRSYLGQYFVREALIERRADATARSAFDYANAQLRQSHPDRLLVMTGDAASIRLARKSTTAAAAQPAPESQPPAQGSSTSTTRGSSSTPPPDNNCTRNTLGVVSCTPGD